MCITFANIEKPNNEDSREMNQAECTNLCHLFARAFDLPSSMEPQEPRNLRHILSTLSPSLRNLAKDTADIWEAALLDREHLDLAYARLFLGPFEILAPPYASFYLEPDQRILGEVSQYVAQAYETAGLATPNGPREAPDHIACEMEFAYYMGFQTVTTDDPIWPSRQQAFWNQHLLLWLPEFCKYVVQAKVHPFYESVATLLDRFVKLTKDSLLDRNANAASKCAFENFD